MLGAEAIAGFAGGGTRATGFAVEVGNEGFACTFGAAGGFTGRRRGGLGGIEGRRSVGGEADGSQAMARILFGYSCSRCTIIMQGTSVPHSASSRPTAQRHNNKNNEVTCTCAKVQEVSAYI